VARARRPLPVPAHSCGDGRQPRLLRVRPRGRRRRGAVFLLDPSCIIHWMWRCHASRRPTSLFPLFPAGGARVRRRLRALPRVARRRTAAARGAVGGAGAPPGPTLLPGKETTFFLSHSHAVYSPTPPPAPPQADPHIRGRQHVAWVDGLFQRLAAGISLARALKRTIVLPPLYCYCERHWARLAQVRGTPMFHTDKPNQPTCVACLTCQAQLQRSPHWKRTLVCRTRASSLLE
jgi:hypothetical protein